MIDLGALQAKMDAGVTTFATCITLTLTDGTVQRFTDHVTPITVGGQVYAPDAAYDHTAAEQTTDMSSPPLDVELLIGAAGGASRADIEAGRYDDAAVHLFLVDYDDPDAAQHTLRRGRLGHIRFTDQQARTELRGVADRLRATQGRDIQPNCDAEFGDARCGLDTAPFTHTGTVTNVTDRRSFQAGALGLAANLLDFGLLTWTGGDNAGRAVEVRSQSAGGDVVLAVAQVDAIQVGDTFSVVEGCDHTFETCQQRFANLVNFRGFPFVPGADAMQDRPDAR